ncbi:L-serine ammonia-lyase [Rhodococcus sp. ACT016]|uniref:L-serine ammonia-lyase n=1 Tax=Rhodococcus sp. ACT016 TaxID=3134808 RepID=UPI003D2841F5
MTRIGVFDLFTVGIGPSSSHTVGPMRAARDFALAVSACRADRAITSLHVDVYGSLAATGQGHNTFGAILLGLEGNDPERIEPDYARRRVQEIEAGAAMRLAGTALNFTSRDLQLHPLLVRGAHANELRFRVSFDSGAGVDETYYSVGGGFIEKSGSPALPGSHAEEPFPFDSAAELLAHCTESGLSIAEIMLANEKSQRSTAEVRSGVLGLWTTMRECIDAGFRATGFLPGGLQVPRRAAGIVTGLRDSGQTSELEWATAAAMAVNEENAAGGRVVTAPTNGAAGIIPAVLFSALRANHGRGDDASAVIEFLLTATAIGTLYKKRASISGADLGCQGEVGSACSMAAAGYAALSGGTPEQIENAAEIGMEHNLGLTCDPVGGLVQIPCIERNGMGAVTAIHAARVALHGNGSHHVSLDAVIETMRITGADMDAKYRETSRGGLAVTVAQC